MSHLGFVAHARVRPWTRKRREPVFDGMRLEGREGRRKVLPCARGAREARMTGKGVGHVANGTMEEDTWNEHPPMDVFKAAARRREWNLPDRNRRWDGRTQNIKWTWSGTIETKIRSWT